MAGTAPRGWDSKLEFYGFIGEGCCDFASWLGKAAAGKGGRGSSKLGIRGEAGEASEGKVDEHILRRARW